MRRRLLTLVTALLVTVAAIAQTLNVNGIVVDENNEAVIGASILISGSKNGTKTDLDGKFTLKGVKASDKLVVSYVGMKTRTVSPQASMKIVLENDDQVLDEVMVVAFGEQKKAAFAGSACYLSSKKL